jgi:hypothetical protein
MGSERRQVDRMFVLYLLCRLFSPLAGYIDIHHYHRCALASLLALCWLHPLPFSLGLSRSGRLAASSLPAHAPPELFHFTPIPARRPQSIRPSSFPQPSSFSTPSIPSYPLPKLSTVPIVHQQAALGSLHRPSAVTGAGLVGSSDTPPRTPTHPFSRDIEGKKPKKGLKEDQVLKTAYRCREKHKAN